jgi:hypothetical protein
MKLFGNVILRVLATFVASALGVIGAGSLGGVPAATAAFVGGILAVAKVIEKLSLAFLEDGKLSQNEIDAAFQQSVQLKGVKAEEAPVAAPKTVAEAVAEENAGPTI